MELHELNRYKIEKFFHSDGGQDCMKIAGDMLKKAIDEIHNDFAYRFRDYLQDEYSLFFEDCVRDGIRREVEKLLLGDEKVLERYCLAPADWGLRCDHEGIRRKICEDNKDIIGDTYMQSLEEENATLRERIEFMQRSGY